MNHQSSWRSSIEQKDQKQSFVEFISHIHTRLFMLKSRYFTTIYLLTLHSRLDTNVFQSQSWFCCCLLTPAAGAGGRQQEATSWLSLVVSSHSSSPSFGNMNVLFFSMILTDGCLLVRYDIVRYHTITRSMYASSTLPYDQRSPQRITDRPLQREERESSSSSSSR